MVMDDATAEMTHDTAHWLRTGLGDYLVLAEPQSGCIGLLNPLAAWVLEAKTARLTDAEIASSLATQFGIDISFAHLPSGTRRYLALKKGGQNEDILAFGATESSS